VALVWITDKTRAAGLGASEPTLMADITGGRCRHRQDRVMSGLVADVPVPRTWMGFVGNCVARACAVRDMPKASRDVSGAVFQTKALYTGKPWFLGAQSGPPQGSRDRLNL